MIGIYKITSPTNRIYIGQTINYNKRITDYKCIDCKNQIKLYRSFKKYGVNNHIFEFVEECDINQLNERERYWQEYYNVLQYGLNCKLTKTNDKSGILSNETKLKIGLSNKGNKPRLGMKNSIEMNLKISESHKGKIIPIEHRISMSKASPNKKKVIDINTNIIYDSIKEVSKKFNINYGTLKSYLKNTIPNKTSFIYYE